MGHKGSDIIISINISCPPQPPPIPTNPPQKSCVLPAALLSHLCPSKQKTTTVPFIEYGCFIKKVVRLPLFLTKAARMGRVGVGEVGRGQEKIEKERERGKDKGKKTGRSTGKREIFLHGDTKGHNRTSALFN